VEPFADAVRLRAFRLGSRVLDVFDGQVELVRVPVGRAAIFAAAVGQDAVDRDLVLGEEREHAVVQQVRRRDRRLFRVELRRSDLAVGVDEGLLVDASSVPT
jgi:hypothetical protein